MSVIIGKLAIGILCFVAAFLANRSRWVSRMSAGQFSWAVTAAVLATRLAVFMVLFVILGYEVQSDIPAAYYPEAKKALLGQVVYRDFFSTYSPLFPYTSAVAVGLWDSMKSLVLLAIVFETIAVPIWMKVGALVVDESVLRSAAILYVFNPLLISTVAIAGQNHVWISPFLAGTFLLLLRNVNGRAGILYALGLLVSKFLAVIFLPVLFVFSRKRWRFVSGFALVTVAALAVMASVGANPLLPLAFQRSAGQESSGNIPYLLGFVDIPMTWFGYVLIAVCAEACICIYLWMRRTEWAPDQLLAAASVCVFVTVLLFSKKAYTTYWACCCFCLCLLWAKRFASTLKPALVLWAAIAGIEPTLFFRWTDGALTGLARLSLPELILWISVQVVLIGFGLIAVSASLSELRETRREISWAIPVPVNRE